MILIKKISEELVRFPSTSHSIRISDHVQERGSRSSTDRTVRLNCSLSSHFWMNLFISSLSFIHVSSPHRRLVVPAGKATAAPPVGPALGARGVKSIDFVKDFNGSFQPPQFQLFDFVAN